MGAEGFLSISHEPLSAQAQTPRRPSGADKKQKPAEKQGGHGRSRSALANRGWRRPTLTAKLSIASRHCQSLGKCIFGKNHCRYIAAGAIRCRFRRETPAGAMQK